MSPPDDDDLHDPWADEEPAPAAAAIPDWPPEWVEDHDLAAEQVVAAADGVELSSALRADDRVLMALSWPGGRRYMLVDPVGNEPAQALRAGEIAQDVTTARAVDALWSRALTLAKAMMDGELEALVAEHMPPEDPPSRRRPWRRGRD